MTDSDSDLPGGTPVENDIVPVEPLGERPGHPMTAADAWVFVRKVIA